MIRRSIIALILFVLVPAEQKIFSQVVDSTSFKIFSRLSFYTFEKEGELLLHIPANLIYSNLTVTLSVNDAAAGSWKGVPGRRIIRIPIVLDLPAAEHRAIADFSVSGIKLKYRAVTSLIILKQKANEVKTDRLTGGLIVNGKPFFPFGFYTYFPVHPTLPEEEVVKGFNMISPYQKIVPETFSARKAYMDRCARLGMKVHYNLLSVSGGGGVGSVIEGLTDARKKELLVDEIKAFRDHPALLAWYIADEPSGSRIKPDSLVKIYKLIREYDPWHPVSIVFMAPFMTSRQYTDALDIVMADPYPVPDSPISLTGDAAGTLSAEFNGKMPVWIVPQAFGGGEWWSREPSIQEMRSMTYQAIIRGARGIQYFVRQGLNLFPKSAAAWGECGRMAVEIAELTPWLLSDEEPVQVRSGSRNIIATSAVHDGQLIILTANKTNSPQKADLYLGKSLTGKVKVLFENRSVNMTGGYLSDHMQAFGSQVYLFDMRSDIKKNNFWKENLIRDPGFEDISSPGVPASCYARSGGDRGATYFLDSREHFEGNHSIRMVTPTDNRGIRLRFFPFRTRNGGIYYISVWAKADLTQGPYGNDPSGKRFFEISLGDFGRIRFELASDWKEYVTIVTIPYYNDQPPRTNVILELTSAGVAWFDMLQAAEIIDFNKSINPELFIDVF